MEQSTKESETIIMTESQWHKIATDTAPTNKTKAIKQFNILYNLLDKTKPIVIFVNNPILTNRLAAFALKHNLMSTLSYYYSNVYKFEKRKNKAPNCEMGQIYSYRLHLMDQYKHDFSAHNRALFDCQVELAKEVNMFYPLEGLVIACVKPYEFITDNKGNIFSIKYKGYSYKK